MSKRTARISVMGICMEDALRRGMTPEEFVGKCKELGADGVEFASRHLPGGLAECFGVRMATEGLGMAVSSCNVVVDLVGADAAARSKRREDLMEGLAMAGALGSPVMMIGTTRPKDMPAAEARKRITASLREAIDLAASTNIRLTMENRGLAFSDVIGRAADIKALCEAVGLPWFGWTFDTGNFIMADEDAVSALRTLLPFVAHVHVKDVQVVPFDQKNPYHEVCIGKGQTDIAALLKMLKAARYEGFLSLEVTHGATREADLRESIQCIRDWWGG